MATVVSIIQNVVNIEHWRVSMRLFRLFFDMMIEIAFLYASTFFVTMHLLFFKQMHKMRRYHEVDIFFEDT
jgi:hypothetical protein